MTSKPFFGSIGSLLFFFMELNALKCHSIVLNPLNYGSVDTLRAFFDHDLPGLY